MAEFKKLSAVETVEAVSETAHVLIEENGVIKRAANMMQTSQIVDPYAAYDCVFIVSNMAPTGSYQDLKLIKGDYETIYNKYINLEPINVFGQMYFWNDNHDGAESIRPFFEPTYYIYLDSNDIYIRSIDDHHVFILSADGRASATAFD